MRFSLKSTVCMLTLITGGIACSENQSDIIGPVTPTQVSGHAEAAADSLAQGIARAIADEDVRKMLRDDLRDSPFPSHALHFWSYARSSSGARILERASRALGISVADLFRIEKTLPRLEIVIPRSMDRLAWQGGSEINVIATPLPLETRISERRGSEKGFDLFGNRVVIPTLSYSAKPYVMIRPYESKYPENPEAERNRAAKGSGLTVTTPREERQLLKLRGSQNVARLAGAKVKFRANAATLSPRLTSTPPGCDPEQDPNCCPPTADTCPGDPGGAGPWPVGNGGSTLAPEKTYNYCMGVTSTFTAESDRDSDQIQDDCEVEIAQALTPIINLSINDEAPGMQTYWTASRHPDRTYAIKIMYALSYFDDAGDPTFHFTAHHGDSEWIILEVQNSTTSIWGVTYATLSAHYGAENDATATYYWDDLEWPNGAHPRIWSSWNKHANYRSKEVCGWGPGGLEAEDGCEGDYIGWFVSVQPGRNLGNYFNRPEGIRTTSTQLVNCTTSDYSSGRTGTECYWTDTDTFGGWYPVRNGGATPYRDIFSNFFF